MLNRLSNPEQGTTPNQELDKIKGQLSGLSGINSEKFNYKKFYESIIFKIKSC